MVGYRVLKWLLEVLYLEEVREFWRKAKNLPGILAEMLNIRT